MMDPPLAVLRLPASYPLFSPTLPFPRPHFPAKMVIRCGKEEGSTSNSGMPSDSRSSVEEWRQFLDFCENKEGSYAPERFKKMMWWKCVTKLVEAIFYFNSGTSEAWTSLVSIGRMLQVGWEQTEKMNRANLPEDADIDVGSAVGSAALISYVRAFILVYLIRRHGSIALLAVLIKLAVLPPHAGDKITSEPR